MNSKPSSGVRYLETARGVLNVEVGNVHKHIDDVSRINTSFLI